MKCTRPVLERCKIGPVEIVERPCGVCPACRANRAQNWCYRLYCESKLHDKSVFVTLTYDDEHLKKLRKSPLGLYSLDKKELQTFMKMLRKNLSCRIRFFGVGEYGSMLYTHRPHYHLIIFGIDDSESEAINKAWPKGFVTLGTVTPASIAYVSRYCVKKLIDDDVPMEGLEPEFNLQSNRPGIGFGAIDKAVMRSKNGNLYCWYEGKRIGLPKYFKDKVRTDYERFVARKRGEAESTARNLSHSDAELRDQEKQREANIIAGRRARKKV